MMGVVEGLVLCVGLGGRIEIAREPASTLTVSAVTPHPCTEGERRKSARTRSAPGEFQRGIEPAKQHRGEYSITIEQPATTHR